MTRLNITILIALLLSPFSILSANPASWPASTSAHQWVAYRDANGNIIQDPNDMSPDYLDIFYSQSDPASVRVAFDGSTAFFRMQLEESPIHSNGTWVNGTWLVQFGTAANGLTGTLYVNVNGQNGVVGISDGTNTDVIYSFSASNSSPQGVRVLSVPGATTWYIDFQVPLSALNSGTNVHLGLTQTTVMSFYYGTSTASGNPNQISKDLMYGTGVNFSNLTESTFSSINGGILPVELTSFHAHAKGAEVQLRWTTATETNNFGFAVERSADGATWQEIGFVAGAGNSSIERRYTFSDTPVSAAPAYSYRLRQIDRDGTEEMSPVVMVTFRDVNASAITDAYPNPFNPTTTVNFTLEHESAVTLQLADAAGRIVQTVSSEAAMSAGAHAVTINATQLPSGRYFVLLRTAEHQDVYPVILAK